MILLAKFIIFLNLFKLNVNDYSMLFARAVTALFSTKLQEADAKPIKQQLLDDFW